MQASAVDMIYIVLNWNKPDLTLQCVSQLLRYESSASVLVVDNGSATVERERLTKRLADSGFTTVDEGTPYPNGHGTSERVLLLLRLKRNYGYAVGNNHALELCKGLGFNYATILNNDVLISSGNSKALADVLSSDQRVAVVGVDVVQHGRHINPLAFRDGVLVLCLTKALYPLFYLLVRFLQFSLIRRATRNCSAQGVYQLGRKEYLSGCYFACSVRALSEVGYFDPGTFLNYEEPILKARLEARGYTCAYISSVAVQHRGGETKKDVDQRELDRYSSESLTHYLQEYRGFGPVRLLAVHAGDLVWRCLWRPMTVLVKQALSRLSPLPRDHRAFGHAVAQPNDPPMEQS